MYKLGLYSAYEVDTQMEINDETIKGIYHYITVYIYLLHGRMYTYNTD